MKFRLTVEQFEPNANYEDELQKWNNERRYSPPGFGYEPRGPEPVNVVRVLTCEITAEEFAAVKKAALEVMK